MTTVPTTSTSDDAALRSAVGAFFRRMIPLLVIMLIVRRMDRANIGFGRHDLEADLGIGAAACGLGAGLLFVAYAIFEVPSTVLVERFGARDWLTRIMISWGGVRDGVHPTGLPDRRREVAQRRGAHRAERGRGRGRRARGSGSRSSACCWIRRCCCCAASSSRSR